MSKPLLKIGEISFLNALPLSLTIEDEEQALFISEHPCEIISETPGALNKLMLEGQLDISPVSSVFYLNHQSQLSLLDHCCIGSEGPVESVLWFYNQNLGKHLDTVWVPDTSETSILLLKWLMQTRGITAENFQVYPKGDAALILLGDNEVALLSIGDEALMLSAACYEDIPFTERYAVIDVASEWREQTNLPCVFAVWVAQENFMTQSERKTKKIIKDLSQYYQARLSKFENDFAFQQHVITIAKQKYPALAKALGEDAIRHYLLNALTYEFKDPQKLALNKLDAICQDVKTKSLQGIS